MKNLNSFISKKIISLKEGNILGYVLDVVLDEELKMLNGLLVVDDESEQTFTLEYNNIKVTGEDCLFVDGSYSLELSIMEKSNNPIGKPVYDTAGIDLGVVTDIVIEGHNVKKIITSKCEFLPRYVQKVGNCIIYGKKPKMTNKAKITRPAKMELPKVYIENEESRNSVKVSENKINRDTKINKPIRVVANPQTLVGKTVCCDIFGYNQELIVKRGEKINNNIINKAKMHNKLNFMLYNCK